MTNRKIALLGGVIAFICVVTLRPACASDQPDEGVQPFINKAAVVGEDARVEYFANVRNAATASMHQAENEELHCNYIAAPNSNDKTFRFEDGNKVVFSAAGKNRIQFVAVDGAKTQIEDEEGVHRKNWWCQKDGVVLFETVLATNGSLSGVKVEWFDSSGTRRTETQVNIAPYGESVNWSYESSRLVDECLGLTFKVQEGKASAKFIEYKLCPKGI